MDPFFVIALIAGIIALFLANLIALLLDILYFFIIFLAIALASPKMTHRIFLRFAVSEIIGKQRIGLKHILLPTEYEKDFSKGEGFSALLKMVIFFNFFALLLIIRYFGLQGANLKEIFGTLILASVLAALISFFITPMAVAIYVLEGTRVREFDEKNFKVEYPAYFYRRLIRSIFGYSNLIVLVWLFVDLLKITNLNIALSVIGVVDVVIVTFGSISLGAILALITVRLTKSDVVRQQIDLFDEEVKNKTMPAWEFIEGIEDKFKREKPKVEIKDETIGEREIREDFPELEEVEMEKEKIKEELGEVNIREEGEESEGTQEKEEV